jgi:hypothetical protein
MEGLMCNRILITRIAVASLLLSAGACAQGGDGSEAAPVEATSQALTSAPAASTPTSSQAELSARAAIAVEDVSQLDATHARDYRRAEIAALKAALVTKSAALTQAQSTRSSASSSDRTQLDKKISDLSASISDSNTKVQQLSAQPL